MHLLSAIGRIKQQVFYAGFHIRGGESKKVGCIPAYSPIYSRLYRSGGHETETFTVQFPKPWPSCIAYGEKIKHHKYGATELISTLYL